MPSWALSLSRLSRSQSTPSLPTGPVASCYPPGLTRALLHRPKHIARRIWLTGPERCHFAGPVQNRSESGVGDRGHRCNSPVPKSQVPAPPTASNRRPVMAAQAPARASSSAVRLFDAHCHLQDPRVAAVAPALIRAAAASGVARFAVNGTSEVRPPLPLQPPRLRGNERRWLPADRTPNLRARRRTGTW